ncbi:uncharacterized protein LAESUDRAFT_765480 [Laetiporus sulphureus 93-53]|uniref:Uncharacterized protein n=1 Tax=Laetiporus sulphureus 93-53 TaxID=1314785 RepID=A0A165AQV5_9APHY|nr:uncharacterized protein LAESUDRAFT_765480 [Laetiporus sulphureus 93-53]KZS99479.1 hypothetical protein LAESUDRAFT_765480 [Laetiporus sulphureus 93-53]
MSEETVTVKVSNDEVEKAYESILPLNAETSLVEYWRKKRDGELEGPTEKCFMRGNTVYSKVNKIDECDDINSMDAVPRKDNPHQFQWVQTIKKGEKLPPSWELLDESDFYDKRNNGKRSARLVLIQQTK